jgi:hypothetical protein
VPYPDIRRVRSWLFSNVLTTMHQQPGPARERDLVSIENPIIVPSRRTVVDLVDEVLARRETVNDHIMGLDRNARDPDRLYIEDHEIGALEEAQRRWEVSVEDLLVALMAGGRPPRRWTVRRWSRHVAWLRWYLREGAGARRRTAWPTNGSTRASSPALVTVEEPPF